MSACNVSDRTTQYLRHPRRLLPKLTAFTMTSARSVVSLVAVLLAGVAVAGPPDLHPLPLNATGVKAASLTPARQAFYWSDKKKIYLNDTGLAVAKMATRADAKALGERQPLALMPDNPLDSFAEIFEQDNLVIVRTDGPESLGVDGQAGRPKGLTYLLPIVEAQVGGIVADENPGRELLIMTPRVIAKFRGVADARAVDDYLQENGIGMRVIKGLTLSVPGAYYLELTGDQNITYDRLLSAANDLYEKGGGQTDNGTIVYCHVDFVATKTRLGGAAAPGRWHLDLINISGAWSVTKGRGVTVAIIDDSVQRSHPHLAPNFKAGRYYNGINGTYSDDPSPRISGDTHGTACAGVAVGNGIDDCASGAAPEAGLIGVHFWQSSVAQTADAFYFCAENGAAVISCSWKWGARFDATSAAINDLAANGRGGLGIVVLFASANDSAPINIQQSFGTLSSVICVGASNWRDERSAYSNFGPELSVVAPSNDSDRLAPGITTSDNSDDMPRRPNQSFSGRVAGLCNSDFGGTSAATPLAAGICALILSVNPELSASSVREILEDTAVKVQGLSGQVKYDGVDSRQRSGHNPYYGHGRIDATAAIGRAIKERIPR